MRTDSLKVNVNNIKREMNSQYFKYRDMFYRMLVANICIYNYMNYDALRNTIFEDSSYNQFFLYIANKRLSLEEILTELNIIQELPLYMDVSLYIEEFIQQKHSNNHINVYSLTISDEGYLVIYNKRLDRINANVQP
jgi:hypothetical protein